MLFMDWKHAFGWKWQAVFDKSSSDLDKAIAAEDSTTITYDKLGIHTARECYEKARDYARLASTGYSPVTETECLP